MKISPSPRPAVGGSALIITLFFMGMITVVIVGVLISARLERSVAHSHFDQQRAGEFAREGVERVIATLDKQTAYKYTVTDTSTTGASTAAYRYRNYLTRPGGLVVPSATPSGTDSDKTTQNVLAQSVPLSSGTPLPSGTGSSDPVYAAPSLNIPSFVQQSYPTYLIDDRLATASTASANTDTTKPPAMKLKWIYLHQDPQNALSPMYDDPVDQSVTPDSRANDSRTTDIPKIDTARPIVGRFAYWTDDESTKLNYNLAWKKGTASSGTPNLKGTADPSRIGLQALLVPNQTSNYLSEAQADKIHNWTTNTPGRYFNSFEDARQIGSLDSAIPPLIDYNKFELTHYSHDPDTTFFGEDRILLTTDPTLVPKNPDGTYARKFLDILREDLTPQGKDFRTYSNPLLDPGDPNNIAAGQSTTGNKLDAVVKNLVRYISQTNWPIMPLGSNASFQSKYYGTGTVQNPAAVAQLAVCIIDYVRMRESARQIVPATRFGLSGGVYSTASNVVTLSSTAFQGTGRVPFCTEMAVAIESKGSPGVKMNEDGTANGWPSGPPLPGSLSGGAPVSLYRACNQYEFYLPVRCGMPGGIQFATPPKTLYPTDRFRITPLVNGDFTANRYIEGEDLQMAKLPAVTSSPDDFRGYSVAVSTNNTVIHNPTGSPATAATSGILLPGGYAVVSIKYYRDQPAETPPKNFALRVQLSKDYMLGDGISINKTPPMADPTGGSVLIIPQSPSTTMSNVNSFAGGSATAYNSFLQNMKSYETDDPRCCIAAADWQTQSTPSWGARSKRWSPGNAPDPTVNPQQDTDNNGKVSDYSLYMPPPKVTNGTDPEVGHVTSVGELGYIVTGLSASQTVASVNWRTLRLQASNLPTTVLPDWAFMDLFAVPNVTTNSTTTTASTPAQTPSPAIDLHDPHGNTVGGRVNINAAVIPFADVTHDRGLAGLLYGANKPIESAYDTAGKGAARTPVPLDPQADVEPMVVNIATQKLVDSTNLLTPKKYGTMNTSSTLPNPAYDTPGELCEIKRIGDQGEMGEDLIRQISSLTCTRGDVFSVYTVGQAVQQSPTGKLTVTAEQRQQSMVERYVANRNTTTAADDQVRFRTVYTRNLTP